MKKSYDYKKCLRCEEESLALNLAVDHSKLMLGEILKIVSLTYDDKR
jgi:hypothetical protein